MTYGESFGAIRSVAIGPANYAGQATAWAKACRTNLNWNACSFGYGSSTGHFGYRIDRSIGEIKRLAIPSLRPAIEALSGFEAVVIDGFVSVSGVSRVPGMGAQIRSLENAGKTVFLVSHGTDTRDPYRHMEQVQASYFRDAPPAYVRKCGTASARNRRLTQNRLTPLLVSTPDLQLDNPGSVWLPVCIDIDKWSSDAAALDGKKPRVLHLPSRRTPPIKGTQHIEPVLLRLHEEGLIESVIPESVRHDEMPGLIKSVDVVVDQIQTGSYGVAAVEAMAARRLVVGNVSAPVRDLVPSYVPIVDATPADLEAVLRRVVKEKECYQPLAESGLMFAKEFHDGRRSASALLGVLT